MLEVGCVDGRYLERLRERGWSVAGIDVQPQEKPYIVEHFEVFAVLGDALPTLSAHFIVTARPRADGTHAP